MVPQQSRLVTSKLVVYRISIAPGSSMSLLHGAGWQVRVLGCRVAHIRELACVGVALSSVLQGLFTMTCTQF